MGKTFNKGDIPSAGDFNGFVQGSDLSATTGSAAVGSDDGASGSLWTTVAGFIAKIISSAGASVVGFIQAGAGAVATDQQTRGRQLLWVTDFAANGTSGARADPTGVTDSTAGIQAAINACNAAGGGTVRFPSGTFKTSSALTLLQGVYLEGAGADASVIKNYAASGNTIATQGTVYATKLGISKLGIQANTPASITDHVYINNCDSFHVKQCHIHECSGADIHVNNAFFCDIEDNYIDCANLGTGISFTGAANGNTVRNCTIYDAGVYGINIDSSHENSIVDCCTEYGKATATLVRLNYTIATHLCRLLIIDNNNRAQPVVMTGASGTECQDVKFTACTITNSGTVAPSTATGYGVDMDNTLGVTFDTCRWLVNVNGGVRVGANCARVVFVGGYSDNVAVFTCTSTDVVSVLSAPGWEDTLRTKDGLFRGHLRGIGSNTPPTIAAGAGAGASPTVSISGSDIAGTITLTTGASGVAAGQLANITFHAAFGSAPAVVFTPGNNPSAAIGPAFTFTSTTAFDLRVANAPTINTNYVWYYHVIGN